MKRIAGIAAAALLAAASFALNAQVQPFQYTSVVSLVSAATSTGAAAAVRAPSANKTFQAVASTSAGTGTAVITVQGSNDGAAWDPITTLSVTTSTTPTSTSTSSTDRYVWIRGNVTTLTGTGALLNATAGF